MGAILTQIDKDCKVHAISYVSKQLIKHGKNYSPFLLEMDAVVWAIEYYQEHLQGCRFLLYTNHKPLESLGTMHTKTMNRLQLAMMDFDLEIRYKRGSEMPADYLSRSYSEVSAISVLGFGTGKEQLVKFDKRKSREKVGIQVPNARMVQKGRTDCSYCDNKEQHHLD
jgi:hypothetical protein